LGWQVTWVNALFAIILLLIGVTIVNRCRKALREVSA